MDANILSSVGMIAGIGGLALGVFLLIFRDVIRKNIFPNLSQTQAYRIIRLILLLTFVIAAAGIGAWVFVQANPLRSELKKPEVQSQTPSFAAKPLAKSTVEIWYSDEGDTDVSAMEIKDRLESVGAKVSLRVSRFPYPFPMKEYMLYYRDPSNLEAAVEAQKLLRMEYLSRNPASIGLPTATADLTITLSPIP